MGKKINLIRHCKICYWKLLSSHSKVEFYKKINRKGKLLDVGCGSNSPYFTKMFCPDIYYVGIDVGDYNQSKPNLADKYIIVSPENFAERIMEMTNEFDTVISSHNLEHCNDREKTLDAMTKALKCGGYIYLSFPTEKSVDFPGPRDGCLNYYDDSTHKNTPPNYDKTIMKLKENGMEILFSSKQYKPFLSYFFGFIQEWKSKREKRTFSFTWAYYGFETVIWAIKK